MAFGVRNCLRWRARNGADLRGVYERAGFRFPALPHAREEIMQIARVFPADKTRMMWAPKRRAWVKSARLADYKRLHFATHTIFDERSPERTGIVLTPVGNDDGILRARDILKPLRLDADMVVLSACQSGLGKLVRGEGTAGLSQAFLYAGAERVLVSRWEVNDLATSDLMTRFYAGLSRNVTPGRRCRRRNWG